MAISSGLSFNYSVNDVTYGIRILDSDDDPIVSQQILMPLPSGVTDISYWDDAIYAFVDQLVTTSGFSPASIARQIAADILDNVITLDPLTYPKP
jgi:hypothetical protein